MRRCNHRAGSIGLLLGFVLWACSVTAWAGTELRLPSVPVDGEFVHDHAGILGPEVRRQLGALQYRAFHSHDTPLVVVTIDSMHEYGGADHSIERFARAWFDHWEIGKRGEQGELINRGILLLISTGDRRARIELGAEWGTRWDEHAARIMDGVMVPEFERHDYGTGVLAGAQGLLDMAERGPRAKPPGQLAELFDSMGESPLVTTPLPLWAMIVLGGGGVALIVLAFFLPAYRKGLLIVGVALIVASLILWVLFGLLALYLKERHIGGGFRGGGGFGTGGHSGGGGATGSW